ncbi:hypothetical protein GZH53_09935 [Flavihumibacter sp. R14]|nr:hypothetical protein [Flavihumibacter soli]
MFETLLIKLGSVQPVAKISDEILQRIIRREFGDQADEVNMKLASVAGDTSNGRNRISAAIIRLANQDISAIDIHISRSKEDYRDVIAKAEYPRCYKLGFECMGDQNMKQIYLDDWQKYSGWLNK